jgi:hypothetical protein
MRISVIGAPTTEADIDRSAETIIRIWREVQSTLVAAEPLRAIA